MQIFISTFESIVILMGIGLLGFILVRSKIVPKTVLEVLSPLVLEVALPALVFSDIISKFSPQSSSDWWTLPLWWLALTILLLAVALLAMLVAPKEKRSETGLAAFYPNSIFVPLIILTGLFGMDTPHRVNLFFFNILFPAFLLNTYFLFFLNRKDKTKPAFNWRKVINPVLVATILALTLSLFGLNNAVPRFILQITILLGRMTIPLIMILVGGYIYVDFKKRGEIYLREMCKFVFFVNILAPALALTLIAITRPNFSVALIIFLVAASPPVTTVPVLTARVKGDVMLVNQYLVGSFLACLFTIPLGMWAFSWFYQIPI